jgi:hypothetical protein
MNSRKKIKPGRIFIPEIHRTQIKYGGKRVIIPPVEILYFHIRLDIILYWKAAKQLIQETIFGCVL